MKITLTPLIILAVVSLALAILGQYVGCLIVMHILLIGQLIRSEYG